jgi:hypothetical protein
VSCESLDVSDDWSQRKSQSIEELRGKLVRPRVLRWAGAVHDVPLQWPELVAGLIRAAVEDAAQHS